MATVGVQVEVEGVRVQGKDRVEAQEEDWTSTVCRICWQRRLLCWDKVLGNRSKDILKVDRRNREAIRKVSQTCSSSLGNKAHPQMLVWCLYFVGTAVSAYLSLCMLLVGVSLPDLLIADDHHPS